MRYRRMAIEVESPEEVGYDSIRYNLAESSMPDRVTGTLGLGTDLDGLLLRYGDHRGHSGLRELLAREGDCPADQVLLTPGAAGALFIVATTLLGPGDHLVVVRPNYGTNLETPRAIGAQIEIVDLSFERGWALTADDLARRIRPETRLLSITTPHNPTGMVVPEAELARIVDLAASHRVHLLVDETYRELRTGEIPPFAAARSPWVISVGSLSKAYGLPGLRLGWLLTKDAELADRCLAAKEQIVLTGPIIEEEIGFRVYQGRDAYRAEIRTVIADRVELIRGWMVHQSRIEWVEPKGGVVCFPRIKPAVSIDLDRFYRRLTVGSGTYVGPGHWFEQDGRHFRIGFGWPTREALQGGLDSIARAANGEL